MIMAAPLKSMAYSAQYQQDPAPSEGGMFKREDFRTYNPEKKAEIVKHADDLKWSWDCAFKETTDGSYVVGQLWARLGADYFLVHQIRRRMTFSATVQAIRGTQMLYPNVIIGHLVEDKANGPAVIDTLKHDVPGVIAIEPEGGKEVRASRITALIEAHNVYLPDGEAWVGDYIEEFARFPVGEHDDQVDATSQALTKMAKTGRGGFVITSFSKTWDGRGVHQGTTTTVSAGHKVAEEVKQPSGAMLTKALGRHCPACDLSLSERRLGKPRGQERGEPGPRSGRFQRGGKPGPGRPKGRQNTTTQEVKLWATVEFNNPAWRKAIRKLMLSGKAPGTVLYILQILGGRPKSTVEVVDQGQASVADRAAEQLLEGLSPDQITSLVDDARRRMLARAGAVSVAQADVAGAPPA
jgi:predicted phage terminase large subunit-like protein